MTRPSTAGLNGSPSESITRRRTRRTWIGETDLTQRNAMQLAVPQQTKHLAKHGSQWTLSHPAVKDVQTVERLSRIPGLRLHPEVGTATGLIDAIAAACKACHLPLPSLEKPHATKQDASLFPFQQEGVARLLSITDRAGGALLADDVGCGKTRQAIAYCLARRGRTLIVCPAYVREGWREELERIAPNSNVSVRDTLATKAKREAWEQSRETAQFVVTSYELAEQACLEAFAGTAPTTLVMDEAHYLCGRRTKRSTALRQIATLTPYKLALTATPAYDRPRDFYSLLRVLLGSRFGTPSEFDLAYCAGKLNEWGGIVNKGVSNADELRLRLSYYMVRREKKDVLSQLPPLTRQVVWVDPDDKAVKAFRSLVVGGALSDGNVSEALRATHEGKLQAAAELAIQARQFLLFTYRRQHAYELTKRISDAGVPVLCITGDMPADQRRGTVREAARTGAGVVATIDSAGTGLDGLQGVTTTGIFHALDWSPNKLHQAEGRLHRMGQTGGVLWQYVAMRETADEMVARTVINKIDALQSILGGSPDMRNDMSDALSMSAADESALLAEMYAGLE